MRPCSPRIGRRGIQDPQDPGARRLRGGRDPLEEARALHRRDRKRHPGQGAARCAEAHVRARGRAGHQPVRALQAGARILPRVGDDPRPGRAGSRSGRGRDGLRRQSPLEGPHRCGRHRAHRRGACRCDRQPGVRIRAAGIRHLSAGRAAAAGGGAFHHG